MDGAVKGPSMPLETFLRWHDLPAKVLVTSGYSAPDDDEDSLSSGEIIDLHGVTIGEVVVCVDNRNHRQSLPIHQRRWFEVLSDYPHLDDVNFETVGELMEADPTPTQIRVLESVDTGDELSTLYVEDILTLSHKEENSLVVTNQLLEEISLDRDIKCRFTAQLDPKWYTMQDLVALKHLEFPIRVRLTSGEKSGKGRNNTYVLEDVRQEANVLAQVNKELVAVPLDIDITVALVEGQMLAKSRLTLSSTTRSSLSSSLSTMPSMMDSDTLSVRKLGGAPGDDTASIFGNGMEGPGYFEGEDPGMTVSELYEALQKKSAECLRLEVEVKGLQAKFDRQLKQMQKKEHDAPGDLICGLCSQSMLPV